MNTSDKIHIKDNINKSKLGFLIDAKFSPIYSLESKLSS